MYIDMFIYICGYKMWGTSSGPTFYRQAASFVTHRSVDLLGGFSATYTPNFSKAWHGLVARAAGARCFISFWETLVTLSRIKPNLEQLCPNSKRNRNRGYHRWGDYHTSIYSYLYIYPIHINRYVYIYIYLFFVCFVCDLRRAEVFPQTSLGFAPAKTQGPGAVRTSRAAKSCARRNARSRGIYIYIKFVYIYI